MAAPPPPSWQSWKIGPRAKASSERLGEKLPMRDAGVTSENHPIVAGLLSDDEPPRGPFRVRDRWERGEWAMGPMSFQPS